MLILETLSGDELLKNKKIKKFFSTMCACACVCAFVRWSLNSLDTYRRRDTLGAILI